MDAEAGMRHATDQEIYEKIWSAIAERQTAVYPQASPGGWHLLGLCPRRLFDVQREPPCPLVLGDRVRFVAVDEQSFRAEGGPL